MPGAEPSCACLVSAGMARFYFEFNNEPKDHSDERGTDFPTLDAAIVAGAASLALTAHQSGEGIAETVVVIDDEKGQKLGSPCRSRSSRSTDHSGGQLRFLQMEIGEVELPCFGQAVAIVDRQHAGGKRDKVLLS